RGVRQRLRHDLQCALARAGTRQTRRRSHHCARGVLSAARTVGVEATRRAERHEGDHRRDRRAAREPGDITMPESRYLFLIAGIIGVLAIFQPMIALGRGPLKVKTSAYELSFGLDRVHQLVDRKLPGFAEKRLPADVLQTRDDIKLVAGASRGAVLAYVPVILILLLGGFAVWRKQTPRALALVAIPLALASIAAWFGVRYG